MGEVDHLGQIRHLGGRPGGQDPPQEAQLSAVHVPEARQETPL